MPLPELEAREDLVIKRCDTTGPEVFTIAASPVPTVLR